MQSPAFPRRLLSAHQRLVALLAALTATASLFSALVLIFDGASPEIWLAPSPELLDLASNCDRQAARAQQEQCRRQLLAARAAQARQPVRLAQR